MRFSPFLFTLALGLLITGSSLFATAQASDDAVGKAVYEKSCAVCHKAGIAGAPKTGDKAAWAPLNAKGVDELTAVAISGKGAMPAKGGNASLSDDEVRAAVQYMVDESD
jgi:cytochrome c5